MKPGIFPYDSGNGGERALHAWTSDVCDGRYVEECNWTGTRPESLVGRFVIDDCARVVGKIHAYNPKSRTFEVTTWDCQGEEEDGEFIDSVDHGDHAPHMLLVKQDVTPWVCQKDDPIPRCRVGRRASKEEASRVLQMLDRPPKARERTVARWEKANAEQEAKNAQWAKERGAWAQVQEELAFTFETRTVDGKDDWAHIKGPIRNESVVLTLLYSLRRTIAPNLFLRVVDQTGRPWTVEINRHARTKRTLRRMETWEGDGKIRP